MKTIQRPSGEPCGSKSFGFAVMWRSLFQPAFQAQVPLKLYEFTPPLKTIGPFWAAALVAAEDSPPQPVIVRPASAADKEWGDGPHERVRKQGRAASVHHAHTSP